MLLDVKNTRADPDDAGGYNRLYAKRVRRLPDGSPVRVVGTVSRFKDCGNLVDRGFGGGHIRVLGETSLRELEALEARYGFAALKLTLQHPLREGKLLPPWIFNAPAFLLAGRREALVRLRRAYRRHPRPAERAPLPLSLLIASGIRVPAEQRAGLTAGQRAFVERLEAMPLRLRRSLPDLYLTILREFVEMIGAPAERRKRYDPEQYATLLYPAHPGADTPMPLGLHDPLGSVWHLLQSLGHLRRHGWDRLSAFRVLEFQAAGVLTGRKTEEDSEEWTLMFTHCANVHACGGHRLVLGRETLCVGCRRLVCEQCHHCQRGCVHNGRHPASRPPVD